MTKNDRMKQTVYLFSYNENGELVGRVQRDGMSTMVDAAALASTGIEVILGVLQDAHDQLVKAHLEAELTKVADVADKP